MTVQEALVLAMQKHRAGDAVQAEQIFRQVLSQQPTNLDALHWLGLLSAEQGRSEEAISLLQRVVSLAPNAGDCWNNLGVLLLKHSKSEEAAAALSRAAALKPGVPGIFECLGTALQRLRRPSEAIAAYRKALLLRAALPLHERRPPEKPELRICDILLTLAHHDPTNDAKSLYTDHALWNQVYGSPLTALAAAHINDPDPDRRIRIGYVSTYLNSKPVGRFLSGLFANHDHQHFEICCYSDTRQPDAMTTRLRAFSDLWRDTSSLSDEQLAQLIRDDRVDILIDLGMHSLDHRLMVFARKPAPIQVTYLAYCSTTGLQAIDYRLSDSVFDPDDSQQPFYSERTLRLGSYWCYPPPEDAPDATDVPPSDSIVFGCLNDFMKFNKTSAKLWSGVLKAVPNSRLLLHAPAADDRAFVQSEFLANGIDPARIEFLGFVSPGEYFRTYRRIDIALDPTPWCGGTTTCDALWMGVPVVSLVGRSTLSRGGLSILSRIGLVDLVAYDASQYVAIAAALAHDPVRRQSLRLDLRRRMLQSPIMNAPAFARDFERVLRTAWTRWCEKSKRQ